MEGNTLEGGCSCGRNYFTIEIPQTSTSLAQVHFDNSRSSRRQLGSPFTAWLRVPLPWYHSSTFAYFPDETHRSIRRTFVTDETEPVRQQFCGYCGTQLSRWKDADMDNEADDGFISLTLGSLFEEDLETLEDLGLLGRDEEEDDSEDTEEQTTHITKKAGSGLASYFGTFQPAIHRGEPWFEEMVRDSRLGRIKRQKGGYTSADRSQTIEWEVVEITNDGQEIALEPGAANGKRKRGES